MKYLLVCIAATLLIAVNAEYIGVGFAHIFTVDLNTGAQNTIGKIDTKPPPGTVRWIMESPASTYSESARTFFGVMSGVNTGKYALVRFNRNLNSSLQGPYLNYKVDALYTFDERLFGITANFTIIEYDFHTLVQKKLTRTEKQ